MDDKLSSVDNELFKKLLNTTALGAFNDTSHGLGNLIANKGCANNTVQYEYSPTSQVTLKLLPDNIAEELHKAIALGGESVKKTLALWYKDPNALDAMISLVDMCVAYIGEEVTAILRKHSTI